MQLQGYGEKYLVCSIPDDGELVFNGESFNYLSRDVFSDGSITYHLADGSDRSFGAISDALLRGTLINELCDYPSGASWGM